MVILPELALPASGEGGNGSLVCKGMVWQGEVFKDNFQVCRVFLEQLPEERLKPRAVGSLVIAEDSDRDPGILPSFEGQARRRELINPLQLDQPDGLA